VYLDWAQYPLVEEAARPEANVRLVRFQDLRFATLTQLRGRIASALAGHVLLDPQLHIVEEGMGAVPRQENAH
jgi:hypothetical protein